MNRDDPLTWGAALRAVLLLLTVHLAIVQLLDALITRPYVASRAGVHVAAAFLALVVVGVVAAQLERYRAWRDRHDFRDVAPPPPPARLTRRSSSDGPSR